MDPWNRFLDPALLIPVLGMVLGILMPVVIVLIALNFAWKYQERKHKTIVDLLEKGLPVPRELLSSSRREGSALMRALTLVGLGIGVSAFFSAMFHLDHGLWGIGLIPLSIGVFQLIALKIEPPRPETAAPSAIDLQ